jgi:hypothetical protein
MTLSHGILEVAREVLNAYDIRKWILVAGLLGLVTLAAPAAELRATRVGSRIDVSAGGSFFTSYRFSEEEKYPFFFPVNGPSGASVTSMRNGRYPHHSSLFFGCDKVNGGNYWQAGLGRGRIVSEGAVIARASGPEIVITDVCNWERPGAESPIRDTRRIVISAPATTLRQIDFEIVLEPLMEVTIEKTNHSLFSVRMDPDLAPIAGGTMVNAAGETSEKGTFGQLSPWMACYGRRGAGEMEGLAIFQHPDNTWAAAPWFTRDYGLMSPTPLYWPAEGSVMKLAKGEKVILRYRVLVFSGDPGEVDLAERFSLYAASARK